MPAYERIKCPKCGAEIRRYKNPVPTVDIIIEVKTPSGRNGIVLINRKNFPYGWAIPGGFVDYGESCEQAAVREANEETTLDVKLMRQLGVYSDPARDPRLHTISIVFVAKASGEPSAADDARDVGVFTRENLPVPLAFDHRRILNDYFESIAPHPKKP